VDSRFYRAEIISLDSGDIDDANATASVRFVDYGSFEHVPRHRFDKLTYLVSFCDVSLSSKDLLFSRASYGAKLFKLLEFFLLLLLLLLHPFNSLFSETAW